MVNFVPQQDPKLVIEKPVKPRPKPEDLVKIESPGQPLEIPAPKKRTKKVKPLVPKPKPSKTNEDFYKRDSILIITEKPQAALKIADALGRARKHLEGKIPFYELERNGEKILVASAVGHLYGLTYQPGQVGWPVYKMEWVPATKNAYTKQYLAVIKKLVQRAKDIIVATDFDVEGEVIGWNIVRFVAKKNDARRMKFSTLTKAELERSYEKTLPTLEWGNAYAGETRHKLDWLYGINLSRALMSAIKRTGSFKILSIGRVQGPALKIIVDREKEISSFKPVPYWQVFAHAKGVEFKHVKDIFDEKELSSFEKCKKGEVTTTEKTESLEPPHPFDLTSLQKEAYRVYRLSPSRTLQVAQSLYLDGIISYPRTSSQKIPDEIQPKKILKMLEKHFPETKLATRQVPVEGKKSDPAHPSIYPTGEFKKLEDDEKNIYDLVVKRFIAAFSPDAKIARKNLTLISEEKKFTANASTVLVQGWTSFYPTKIEESNLPNLSGQVSIDKITTVEKETEPPHRYTPASLISLLEKKNLGTKATRSNIVDTLFDRGYLEGTSIKATPLGLKLIESLEKHSPIIIDENLTRNLEEKMEDIQSSISDLDKKESIILEEATKALEKISKDFKAKELEIGQALQEGRQESWQQQKEQNTIMQCPVCQKGNLVIKYSKKTSRYFAACDTYPACTATYPLPPNGLIKTTGKLSPNGLPLLLAIRKGKRPWEFEFNPNYRKEQENKT